MDDNGEERRGAEEKDLDRLVEFGLARASGPGEMA